MKTFLKYKESSLFLLILLFIPLCMIINIDVKATESEREKKTLATLPDVFITNEAFPKKMDNYINDRIGFRTELLDVAEIYPVLQGTNYAGMSSKVISGEDGWLFLNALTTNENIKDFTKTDTYAPAELKKISDAFKEVNDWCLSRGIKLIVMIPPNKHNIYPEYYNKAYTQLERPTRYELVREELKKNNIPFLDLRSALVDAKKDAQLFYKNDTHWNNYSGAIAYSMLVDKMAEMGGKAYKYNNNFRIVESDEYYYGDLHKMCIGCSTKNTDKVMNIEINDTLAIKTIEYEQLPDKRIVASTRESGREGLVKIFVLHDSFLLAVEPLLVRSVSRMVTRWEWGISPLKYADLIIKEKPDFVIWEIHERYFLYLINEIYNTNIALNHNVKDNKLLYSGG